MRRGPWQITEPLWAPGCSSPVWPWAWLPFSKSDESLKLPNIPNRDFYCKDWLVLHSSTRLLQLGSINAWSSGLITRRQKCNCQSSSISNECWTPLSDEYYRRLWGHEDAYNWYLEGVSSLTKCILIAVSWGILVPSMFSLRKNEHMIHLRAI